MGARRGRGRSTRSAARAARVRGASRIGRRRWCSRRAEPVTLSATNATRLHHRVQEPQVVMHRVVLEHDWLSDGRDIVDERLLERVDLRE